MRILLDECVPRRLRRAFMDHEVRTVTEMGWSGKKNGDLLRAMADEGFRVLVTVDQNLKHQQNLQAMGAAVIVLVAANSRLATLVPLVPAVEAALCGITPGDVIEIRDG